MDRGLPVDVGNWQPLIVRDRNQRRIVLVICRLQTWSAKLVMEGGDVGPWLPLEPRELDRLSVEVNDVKTRDIREHQLHHAEVMWHSSFMVLDKMQFVRANRNQPRSRLRIAAGKQRYVMSLRDEFLSQI